VIRFIILVGRELLAQLDQYPDSWARVSKIVVATVQTPGNLIAFYADTASTDRTDRRHADRENYGRAGRLALMQHRMPFSRRAGELQCQQEIHARFGAACCPSVDMISIFNFDKSLGLVGLIEEPDEMVTWNDRILGAIVNEKRHPHPIDLRQIFEAVADQPFYRKKRKAPTGDFRDAGKGRFQDQGFDLAFGGKLNGDAGPQGIAV
jgi:hypothetical protein